jgi:acyl-homoserine lactone acylase PvdQ
MLYLLGGQFFIYQGFNENCGWMHTSSNVDVSDMYAEKIVIKMRRFFEYDGQLHYHTEKTSL